MEFKIRLIQDWMRASGMMLRRGTHDIVLDKGEIVPTSAIDPKTGKAAYLSLPEEHINPKYRKATDKVEPSDEDDD